MVQVRKGNPPRGQTSPSLLISRALGMIDRMAEAMWQEECLSTSGMPRLVDWQDEKTLVREKWTRSATAALLTLLDPATPE